MDFIDISSSDEDLESWETDGRGSTASRVLPLWASTQGTNSRATGYSVQSQNVNSPKGASASNGKSSNANDYSQDKFHFHPGSSNGTRGPNHQSAQLDDSEYFTNNGNALKRTLPSSLQPITPSTRLRNLAENVGGSHVHDTYESSYHSAGPSATKSKGYLWDQFSRGKNDEVAVYENSGTRMLPPSLMHGKAISSSQFVSSSDASYRPMVGEERQTENDERLIYQAALEDLNQPKFEATLPDGLLSISLLRHQKIALAWMLQKETRSLHCMGGILADDQGLGKTISMIALIQMQKSLQSKPTSDPCNRKTEALNLDDDDDNGRGGVVEVKNSEESDGLKPIPEVSTSTQSFRRQRPAAGTLVVCPASVLRQWARELDEKVADEAKLSVLVYHGGSRTKDPVALAKYDVVLTTYAIVTNEVPKQPLVEEDDADEKNEVYGLSTEFSTNKKRKKTTNVTKRGKKGKKGMDGSIDYGCGPLARVGWFRVILDEAQTIKNHRTQVARACCSLRAKRRWCLSGTPIQNAIDDLYSYFRFLKYDPYAVYKSFYNTIKLPISRNSLHGYKKLQAVLRAIMLRRTKGTLIDGEPIIKLPPKTVHLSKVNFSTEERAFYTKLEADSRSQFKAYAAAGTVNQNYANILLMLLRLRQACDHPFLVKDYKSDSVGKDSLEMAKKLPRDMLINLLNCLETSFAICHVCNYLMLLQDPPEDPVVTMCGHVFCYQCVSEYLTGDDNTCPASACKEQLGSDVVFSKATLSSCLSDNVDGSPMNSQFAESSLVLQNEYSSSKIRAVLEILQTHCKMNCSMECNGSSLSEEKAHAENFHSGVSAVKHTTVYSKAPAEGAIKAIVFSQWTSMLDLVEFSLNQFCIQYRRLDGTMTLGARDRAVRDFNTDPEVTVMLMSLKAGNLGLNMVAACHVILLDLWWNPTTEDQAVDRAHRIGQTRPVTVTRITIKDTVEDRILALQEEKRKMVASAFGEDQSGGFATRLTVEDLKYLFMV
ncbi:helicase-like transcription factor CHR28 isoform X1 [Carya illinoinensis]|uniref:helicase-like transcription factor CHR28 isoform X1 n=2 Tax=Carya illinoinensis TaxID=32201 RepID=UPI001C721392|nr:helicase-like transcription factor CHR28 isoform X1 [Carya illinoinensis]XP_042966160.1 helicase-like transcription factor CHR28 isoform X1 [Carya illinoinensis]XP_042966162.1 helicase-like transcription factor CHR28 isoform X1 [Carya illinoinensis]XP_042966163.1 helicase-like transcription factor CHR28 isoform X1 [Carya illinoinensis]XP_042966164.1 helicase-like transcription factor CHR28 isoform X1 [Carya illinoinensis]